MENTGELIRSSGSSDEGAQVLLQVRVCRDN